MRKNKEYFLNYRETDIFPATEMSVQLYPRIQKKKGRWTFEEHQTFVNCLKRYGKNWDILDEMIPTRTSIQIRSHCQKYFDQIKKDYKTDDPMEFVLQNMCDASPLYQFELPKEDQLQSNSLMGDITEENNRYLANNKKRDLKKAQKSIQESLPSTISKDKSFQKCDESYSMTKLFKIETIKKKSKILPMKNFCSSNDAREEFAKPKRKPKQKSDNSEFNVKKGCSLLVLNQGRAILQAERIESSIPLKCKSLNGKFNLVLPNYPCQIQIMPLNQPKESMNPESIQSQTVWETNQAKIQTNKFDSFGANTANTTDLSNPRVFLPQENAKNHLMTQRIGLQRHIPYHSNTKKKNIQRCCKSPGEDS
ncbi:unnamed protein product [Moneuplotes crassus]|uniref:Uncharacterized protein n=1 Tax=Euplotes crassus TaxID=5936 RepID=A0AAD1XCH7_EUPCR|nr:unnamed protein product [Moneuplotes crassus]